MDQRVSHHVGAGLRSAEDLVAAGVRHGFSLAQVPGIFTDADKRVVVRQLVDASRMQFVEPCIADVRSVDAAVFDQRHREDAGHLRQLGFLSRLAIDMMVRQDHSLAQAHLGRAGPVHQPPDEGLLGRLGGYVAARVAAYSVDDGKEPLSGPVDEPVLVGGALPTSVAASSRTNRRYPRHTSKSLVRLAALQARPGFPQMREEQPAGQHQKRDQKE